MSDTPGVSQVDEDEQTYLDVLREYECPNGCDFVDVLSEDDALALFIADQPLCPLCDKELDRTEESLADLLAFVDECRASDDRCQRRPERTN